MLSGKSNLPPSNTPTEIESSRSPLTNEVRRSTLSETLTQANSNIKSMEQHPGSYLFLNYFIYFSIDIILKYF
jgi:hypothetical protein